MMTYAGIFAIIIGIVIAVLYMVSRFQRRSREKWKSYVRQDCEERERELRAVLNNDKYKKP